MNHKILSVLLLVTVFLGVPRVADATPAIEIIDNEIQKISITVNEESVIRITGAAGQELSIYNITGVRVMNLKIDGADRSYSLNLPKGCYIVKVGKMVRKISIR
ncbi:T9SS type A sorting domain-containing protein [Hallella bergensis]|uniref:T9SS type A sorting domain-containing protein n=1 Tax=Hallella bergensis TaxID=242750 RepID=UPI0023EF8B4C|nr:T9SS type A sorting domain-containing protein [Hallella bergensis]